MTTGVGARKKVRVGPDEIASFNRALIANHLVGRGPGRAGGDRPGHDAPARERARQGDDRRAPRARGAHPHCTEHGRASARAHARLAGPGRSPGDGRSRPRPLRRRAAGRRRRASPSSTPTASRPASRRSRSPTSSGCSDALDVAGALDLEAFAANLTILHPRSAPSGRTPGSLRRSSRCAACWRAARSGSPAPRATCRTRSRSGASRRSTARCATRFGSAAEQLEIELNASQENPLLIPDEDRIVSVANFDILPLSAALDFMRIVLASALTSACERTEKLSRRT